MQKTIDDGLELSKKENMYKVFTNSSGSVLKVGTSVCLDVTDSTGTSVTLPSAEGDPNVLGTVAKYAAIGADVLVSTFGASKVRVNGTVDISAGDPLKIFDINGISEKATKGTTSLSTTFAIALEAYTANDSNGLINAFLWGT